MKSTIPSAALRFSCPIAAFFLACALPAAAGVTVEVPIETDEPAMPEFRKKFGVEVAYYHQEQPYTTSGTPLISLPAIPGGFAITNVLMSNIENEVDHAHLKFDYDVLPFLNLFAVLGWVDGETSLTASGTLGQALPNPPPPLPVTLPFKISYEGFVYGIGTTASFGWNNWFTSLTVFYSRTDVDARDSELDSLVIMPRIGYRWDKLSVWVGAMYLQVEEDHSGTYVVDFGPGPVPVSYSVSLEQQEDINFLVGVNYEFSDSWNATLEGGFGDRESIHVGLQCRF